MNSLDTSAPYRLMSREERLRWWTGQWRRIIPAAVTLLLIVLMTAPLFPLGAGLPQLGLLGVFVWAMFQPSLMPPWLGFLLGLITDVLLGLPMGINASLYPLVALFVQSFEARFGRHVYRFDWLMLVAVALVYALLAWQFLHFARHDVALWPLLLQWLTTVATYPVVVALCAALQRRHLGTSV